MKRVMLRAFFVWLAFCLWTARAQNGGTDLDAAMRQQRAAAEAQRQAVKKQAEMAGLQITEWHTPDTYADPPPDCEPLDEAVLGAIIDSAAKAEELKPKLLRAVVEQESGGKPCAVSPKGAQGLMQLMPAAVADLDVHDPFDPKENVSAGARYLKQLLARYKGDTRKALSAYNAGPATVDEAAGVPDIRETRDYVEAIMRKLLPTAP